MTTLSRRATRNQEKALAIIAGAVRTVALVHPDWTIAQAAKSIAKRATGTLTGAFPETFAAERQQDSRADQFHIRRRI
jgi:hypothetical protein